MSQMLSMGNENNQNDFDKKRPSRAESAYNISLSAASGLDPIAVRLDRRPRLLLTVIERRGTRSHQNLRRDQRLNITNWLKMNDDN